MFTSCEESINDITITVAAHKKIKENSDSVQTEVKVFTFIAIFDVMLTTEGTIFFVLQVNV
jgi:hypothetical protein